MGNHWPRGDGVFQREDPTRPKQERTETELHGTRYLTGRKTGNQAVRAAAPLPTRSISLRSF